MALFIVFFLYFQVWLFCSYLFFLFYGSFNSDYIKCNTLPESPLKTSEIRGHQQSWPNPEKTHIIWEIDKKLILKSKIMTDDKNKWLEILRSLWLFHSMMFSSVQCRLVGGVVVAPAPVTPPWSPHIASSVAPRPTRPPSSEPPAPPGRSVGRW